MTQMWTRLALDLLELAGIAALGAGAIALERRLGKWAEEVGRLEGMSVRGLKTEMKRSAEAVLNCTLARKTQNARCALRHLRRTERVLSRRLAKLDERDRQSRIELYAADSMLPTFSRHNV